MARKKGRSYSHSERAAMVEVYFADGVGSDARKALLKGWRLTAVRLHQMYKEVHGHGRSVVRSHEEALARRALFGRFEGLSEGAQVSLVETGPAMYDRLLRAEGVGVVGVEGSGVDHSVEGLEGFLRRYLGGYFDRDFMDAHREVMEWGLEESGSCIDSSSAVVNMPRGVGKTTLLLGILVYRLAYELTRLAVFVARTLPAAKRHVDNLLNGMIAGNEALLEAFPHLGQGKRYRSWDVAASSVRSSIRGMTHQGQRPDWVHLTDLEEPGDKPERTAATREHVQTNVIGALDETAAFKILFDQTRTHSQSLMSDRLDSADPDLLPYARVIEVRSTVSDAVFDEARGALLSAEVLVPGLDLSVEQEHCRTAGYHAYRRERMQDTDSGLDLAFGPLFVDSVHILADDAVVWPRDMVWVQGYDFGHSSPWSVCWIGYWPGGGDYRLNTAFVRRCYIAAEGHGQTVQQQAEHIKSMERDMGLSDVRIRRYGDVNSMYGATGPTSVTVSSAFRDCGLSFEDVSKHGGSRVERANMVRSGLLNAVEDGGHTPVYFMRRGTDLLVRQLKVLRNDPEDDGAVMKGKDDHGYDALSYGLVARPSGV